eukprot:656279-Pleurochrysis_carterae.AAC.1
MSMLSFFALPSWLRASAREIMRDRPAGVRLCANSATHVPHDTWRSCRRAHPHSHACARMCACARALGCVQHVAPRELVMLPPRPALCVVRRDGAAGAPDACGHVLGRRLLGGQLGGARRAIRMSGRAGMARVRAGMARVRAGMAR